MTNANNATGRRLSNDEIYDIGVKNILNGHHPFKRLAHFQRSEFDSVNAIKIVHADVYGINTYNSSEYDLVDEYLLAEICDQWNEIATMTDSEKSVVVVIDLLAPYYREYTVDIWIALQNGTDMNALLVQMKLMEHEPKHLDHTIWNTLK